ncbi:hypothetical protein ASF84_01395 [Pseudomonas sp. Leaf127]|uniref:DUF1654 domain-containing protein n=1 Tax=Pseudomonas sp. Leaf127 TaxID=1736267 RepID=UPI000702A227|nr:DUF1654 domain-containing protein [Pseudomonas sp. Leaf127]KQQ67822.1 hypothetical protein ASF84_01395 [Pseudomonas sp. Leaf127]
MAQTTHKAGNSYEHLVKRVQEIISSPRSQLEHQVTISKTSHESAQDWDRLLEEINDADGVTLSRLQDGSAHIAWFVEKDDNAV